MRTSRGTVISRSALLLILVAGCGESSDTPASSTPRMQETDRGPMSDADQVSMDAQILWSAEVKSTLQPLIESQLGLRNRIETSRPSEPIRIVLLELLNTYYALGALRGIFRCWRRALLLLLLLLLLGWSCAPLRVWPR